MLAELLELAPGGVEEVALGEETIEYAVYGAPGELPELPDLDAAVGDALVEVSSTEIADDWPERWKRFHRPVLIEAPRGSARLARAASVGGAQRSRGCRGDRDRPGAGVWHRRPRHHAPVPGAAARADGARGSAGAVAGCRHRLGGAGDRRRATGVRAGARSRPRARERCGRAGERERERGGDRGAPLRPAHAGAAVAGARRTGRRSARGDGEPAASAAARAGARDAACSVRICWPGGC